MWFDQRHRDLVESRGANAGVAPSVSGAPTFAQTCIRDPPAPYLPPIECDNNGTPSEEGWAQVGVGNGIAQVKNEWGSLVK